MLLASGAAWAGPYKPVVGLAKQAGEVRANSDGTYTVDFELRIQNAGKETLVDVQIRDWVSRWIKPATVVSVSDLRVRGALSEIRPTFDGVKEFYLLSGNEKLKPLEEAFVNFTLTFDAQGEPGPFYNRAMAWVKGKKSGKGKDDFSQNGTDPDPDTPSELPEDNPRPGDDDEPTPIELPGGHGVVLSPALGVAKRAEPTRALELGEFAEIDLGSGPQDPASAFPFVSRIDLVLANIGEAPLVDVQLRDVLIDTFADAARFAVLGPVRTSDTLAPNPTFDGVGDTALLLGTDELEPGASGTISFDVAFDPGTAPGPFFNVAVGTAQPEFPPGTQGPTDPVTDVSDDGTEPDPDGDGDAGESGEDDPTPIDVPAEGAAIIGLAKAASDVERLSADEFGVTITLTVANLGATPLQDVQVTDDLRDTFAAAEAFQILEAPTATGGLPINTGYDGAADTQLLGPGAGLAVGEQQMIQFRVGVTSSATDGAFLNVAFASGVSPRGQDTTDQSTDGINPDPNGDGLPTEDEPTPVQPPNPPSGPGALVGTVFLDVNHDDLLQDGEQRLSGWQMVVRDAQGAVVGETVTDAEGNYRFDDLVAGDYEVSFAHPDTEVTWDLQSVSVIAEETARADLPVDPQGRVYDSLTRVLVPGVTLRLLNAATDTPLPSSCLLPGQQDQTVGSDAWYRFDVQAGADGRCPAATTTYRIVIVGVPRIYILATSERIPPEPAALNAAVCSVDANRAPPCVVLPSVDAPTGAKPTAYFLDIDSAAGDPDVVNNHIPLDRPISPASGDMVTLQKRALTRSASVGDLVFFEVRLQNETPADLTDVSLQDDLPGGFALAPESVVLIDPGADGQVDTGDDVQVSVGIAGTDPVTFGPFTLPANATRVLRYGLRVSTGVTEGLFVNRVTPLQAGIAIGADAQAQVEIVSDAVFDNTTIIGKVFDDRDEDGWQDPAVATGLTLSGGPFDAPLTLPDLRARRAESDRPAVVRLDLPSGEWQGPLLLSTSEGTRLRYAQGGTTSDAPVAAVARGLSGQQLHLRIEASDDGQTLVVENLGIVERGIPGVRLGTVQGLLIEADHEGRFHLADVATGTANRGSNFILKLDTASLPDGARLISENPRVLRLTPALMSRIDFAVALPPGAMLMQPAAPGEVLEVVTRRQRAGLPPVRFDTGRSEIPPTYGQALQALLAEHAERDNLRMTFVGHADPRRLLGRLRDTYGDNVGLSAARAEEVAEFAQQILLLPPSVIGFEGRGARQPVAPNDGPIGWAANRRVEIELSWTQVQQRQFEVASTAEVGAIGVTEQAGQETRELPSLVYRPGAIELEPALIETARAMLRDADEDTVQLELTAHTDNQALSPEAQERFGNNQGLSQARAEAAAAQLRDALALPADAVVARGRGASDPIADNATVAGRAANRRLELTQTMRATQQLERRWITPLQEARSDYLPGGGSVWATEQPLIVAPKLNVLALADRWASGDLAPTFSTYFNYGLFIDRLELRFYAGSDLDRVRPLGVMPVAMEPGVNALPDRLWQQLREAAGQRRGGGELQYVLRAYGSSDFSANAVAGEARVFDETAPRLLQLSQRGGNTRQTRTEPGRSIWGQNHLAVQNIATSGSLVRVMGIDVDPRMAVTVEGEQTPVAADGSFVWEQQRPVGEHQLAVELMDTEGRHHQRDVSVDVDGNYRFAVALANLTVGKNDVQGSLEPLAADDHFDEEVFVDGRIALYAKAKIRGRYLLTAQLDSTEDELRNFGDNLEREDPRGLFRQLDPDRYYTVYGDDSTTVSDVDTQGAFYVRLDFDRSSVLWGNFNTDMVDTEFTQFNRSLYGAKAQLRSTQTTRFGDTKRALTVFGSEAQSAAAHVTFAATGGSLYYLKHTDIVEGSEKVWIEVRRRDSEVVLDREVLIEGRDYEVDALQGRIILSRPLSQVVSDRSNRIIRSAPLEGDNVFLLADYEYVPERFAADDLTAGGRGSLWLGDHLGVGVSKVIDERAGTDYDLEGADVTWRAGRGTYVRAEFARSEAQQNLANFVSADGGLSFQSANGVGAGSDGEALALEARVNLAEVSDNQQGDVRIWWKDRDADFSAGRLNNGTATRDAGLDLYWSPSDRLDFNLNYNELDRDELGTDTVARAQLDAKLGRWQAGAEVRYEDIQRGSLLTPSLTLNPLANPPLLGNNSALSGRSGDGEALLIGGRLGYQTSAATRVYAAAQTVADDRGEYEDNDLVSIGIETTLSERLGIGLELSDGDRGSAVMGAVDFAASSGLRMNVASGFGSGAVSQFSTRYSYGEGHELYGSYAVDPDRTEGPRDMLTFGQRRQFGNHMRIFTETQFGKDDRYASTGHLFGMDYSGIQDWLLTATVQQSDNESLGLDFERLALSLGAMLERNDYRISSRIEFREDEADTFNTRSYLTSNAISWQVSEASRWLALFNMSWTDDEVFGGKEARFIEFDLGHAYRPVWNNRLNILAKYSYLFDLPSEGQTSGRADQRAHLFSAEALYDLTRRWELGAKVGFKRGEERIFRDSGEWLDFGVRMAAIRARYHVLKRWDAVIEYRWIADWLRDTQQQGALLGVYRHLGDHLQVGVGYNFAGFDDDLKREDYDSHGWFIDLVGKY